MISDINNTSSSGPLAAVRQNNSRNISSTATGKTNKETHIRNQIVVQDYEIIFD